MDSLNSRRAALNLICKVTDQKIMINSINADSSSELLNCDELEKRAAMRLTLDYLRNFGPSSTLIKLYVKKTPPKGVLNILQLGVVELCVNKRAAYGVVNDAVNLTHELNGGSAFSGLVNAVLRKVAKDGSERWSKLRPSSLPAWIARPIKKQHGKTIQKAIEKAHSVIPPIDLTLKKSGPSPLPEGKLMPNGSLRVRGGAVSSYTGYNEGNWWVQDAAASMPVQLLGDISNKKILDICAAPGGKTMQLADGGACVTALDVSESKMNRVQQNLKRVGLKADLIVSDALKWHSKKKFDVVLLDAPCSATGTIRRHPDLPFVKTEKNLADLINIQKRLLDCAVNYLKPGGELIYCTCSLLFSEGEDQIEEFLLNNPNMFASKINLESFGLPKEWESLHSSLRIRPDYWKEFGAIDGFFVSKLIKNNSVKI